MQLKCHHCGSCGTYMVPFDVKLGFGLPKKLTKRLIDELATGAEDKVIWDTQVSGFGIKASPSGRKTFILKYRDPSNRQRKPTIGRYGDITLQQARTVAQSMKADLAAGRDPKAEERRLKASISLNEFAEQFFANNKVSKKQSTLAYERLIYDKHVRPTLGKMKLNTIERRDIRNWVTRRQNIGGGVGRVFSLVKAILNYAVNQEIVPNGQNPCSGIKLPPATERNRFLSTEELRRLMRVLDEGEADQTVQKYMAALIKLAPLTGARKNELLSAKWSYVDFEAHLIRLPDSKTGERNLFLADDAIDILKAMPRLNSSEYLFPGSTHGTHLKDPRKSFRRVLERAKIDNFRFHDLRHTHASWGVQNDITMPLLGKTLGHKSSRTTERYAHLDNRPGLRAANLISDAMSKAVAAGLD